MIKSKAIKNTGLLLLLGISLLIGMRFGAVKLTAEEMLSALSLGKSSSHYLIFFEVRLPRVVLGAVLGGGLALVGAVMQGIFRNPLVDAYTLGMSSGASLGAVLAIVTGLDVAVGSFSTLGIFAFFGAVSTLGLVYFLSSIRGKTTTASLLLSGIVLSYFISALNSVLMMLHKNKIEHIVFWNMGSISAAGWGQVRIGLVVMVPCALVLFYFWRELNLISFGEEAAAHLGVNTTKVKAVLLVTSALMVGIVVSLGGTIGFVGLIAPHMARLLYGAEHKQVLLSSMILGAITLVLADVAGRTLIAPAEIPVGVMTAVIAGPFFLYLLRKNNERATG